MDGTGGTTSGDLESGEEGGHSQRGTSSVSTLPKSPTTNPYWLYATRDKEKFPYNFVSQTKETGKFLIFEERGKLMEIWNNQVKPATEGGLLGIAAKVSTARPKSIAIGGGNESVNGVICVYTYTDAQDKDRVREELKKLGLGITKWLPYKTDMDTLRGKYSSGNTYSSRDNHCIGYEKGGNYYTMYQGEFVKAKGEDYVNLARFDEDEGEDNIENWMHEEEFAKYRNGSRKRVRTDDAIEWEGKYAVYPTQGQYDQEGKNYIHIKDNSFKTKDLLFPSDQFGEIIEAMDKLLNHEHKEEDESEVEGVKTSHVRLYGKYSKKDQEFQLCFQSLKKKFTICISQSECKLLFNQLQTANEALNPPSSS